MRGRERVWECFWAICMGSSQKYGSTLKALSLPSPQTLKTLGFKPHSLQELMEISPSCFPSQWLWGIFSFYIPLCATLSHLSLWPRFLPHCSTPSPLQHSWSVSPLNYVFTHPTFFDVAFSLLFIVEFVLSIFKLISGVLGWSDKCLVVFVRWD